MERRMHYRIYGPDHYETHAKTKKSAMRHVRKAGIGSELEVFCCGKFKAAYIYLGEN